nr:hypothetical protein [Anaerolineae bacterium]
MVDIRPLRIRDLPLAYRLMGRGVNFDSHISLTTGNTILQQAFRPGLGELQSYVLRQHTSGSGLGQLHFIQGIPHARLALVAPSLQHGATSNLWLGLLEGLIVEAGQRGVVTVTAEAPEGLPEIDILRRAGFAIYARQTLWRRAASSIGQGSVLRPASKRDAIPMTNLYGQLVPRLVRDIDPPPGSLAMCYIQDGTRGPDGMVFVFSGINGVLIEPYLSAEAACDPAAFVAGALDAVQAHRKTVYARVRDYIGGMAGALASAGFRQIEVQVVMYRLTAVRISHPSYKLKEKIEGGMPLPTSIQTLGSGTKSMVEAKE